MCWHSNFYSNFCLTSANANRIELISIFKSSANFTRTHELLNGESVFRKDAHGCRLWLISHCKVYSVYSWRLRLWLTIVTCSGESHLTQMIWGFEFEEYNSAITILACNLKQLKTLAAAVYSVHICRYANLNFLNSVECVRESFHWISLKWFQAGELVRTKSIGLAIHVNPCENCHKTNNFRGEIRSAHSVICMMVVSGGLFSIFCQNHLLASILISNTERPEREIKFGRQSLTVSFR